LTSTLEPGRRQENLCISSDDTEVGLVLELVKGMPLKLFILPDQLVSIEQRLKLIQEIACALRYLHSRVPKIVHGDLKDTNIYVEMVTAEPCAKLLDFGLSRLVTKHAQPLGGTLNWMAPELFKGRRVMPDVSADVFSFGLVLLFVLTGVRPIRSTSQSKTLKSGADLPHVPWPQERSETLQYEPIVRACTRSDPVLRPTMLKAYLLLSGTYTDHAQKTVADWHDSLGATEETRSSQRPQPRAENEHVISQDGHVDGQERTLETLQRGYLPTPAQTTAQIIMSGIMSCNFTMPKEGFCCAFHQAAKCSVEILQMMCKSRCDADWPVAVAQCLKCGALVLPVDGRSQAASGSSNGLSCDYCGADTYVAAP